MTEEQFLKTLDPNLPLAARQAAIAAWQNSQNELLQKEGAEQTFQTSLNPNIPDAARQSALGAYASSGQTVQGSTYAPTIKQQMEDRSGVLRSTMLKKSLSAQFGNDPNDLFKRLTIAHSKGAYAYPDMKIYSGGGVEGSMGNRPVSTSYSEYNPFAKYQNLLKKKRGV